MNTTFNFKQSGKTTLVFIIAGLIAVGLGFVAHFSQRSQQDFPEFENLLILPKPKVLAPVSFTTHQGEDFSNRDLQGKWTLLFFAFTNCPDICPTTLQTMKMVKQDLEAQELWDPLSLVMISVDPERDTVERLNLYMPFFDPDFIGLTGDLDYTTEFAKKLGVLFYKKEVLEDGNYDVDHSAGMVLINPQGQYAGYIGAPHKREVLSKDLAKLAKHALKSGDIKAPSTVKTSAQPNIAEATPSQPLGSAIISVTNAWIRQAPPTAMSLAGYFQISNNSEQNIEIVAVESPTFAQAMIHETSVTDGVASMHHLDSLVVPANGVSELKPMGKHLMLMRPDQKLSLGDQVSVTLKLSSGDTIDVQLEVKAAPSQ